jgi:thioredoxin 1
MQGETKKQEERVFMNSNFIRASHSLVFGFFICLATFCAAQDFAPLGQWQDAVRAGNSAALQSWYSTTPPTQVAVGKTALTADQDIAFWTGLKPRGLKISVTQSDSPAAGIRQIVMQIEVDSAGPPRHTVYITEGQAWQQQGEQWKLVSVQRTDAMRLQQPTSTDSNKDIYHPGSDAKAEIKEAIERAGKEHKRVILVFGGNWCYDCHVLDLAFHRPDLAPVIQKNYEVVHVDIGQYDKNLDLAAQYNVPMKKGVPGVAVLDGKGKLIYSQSNGEFEKARSLAPADLLAFLNQWKPGVQ